MTVTVVTQSERLVAWHCVTTKSI